MLLRGRRPPRRTSYNGTFVQRILVTAMQAVERVLTWFAISILTRATKLRHRSGDLAKGPAEATEMSGEVRGAR